MKRILAFILVFSLVLSLGVFPALAEDGENLIPGGTFDAKDYFWGLYTESGGTAEINVADGVLQVAIANAGTVGHAVQVYCDGFGLKQGGVYRLTFDLSSSVERYLEWRIQLNGGDYHAYAGDERIQVGPVMQTYSFDFTMQEKSDPAPRLCFNSGDAKKEQGLEAHELTLDNVTLMLIDDSGIAQEAQKIVLPQINVNQVGYRPEDAKVAVFEVLDADSSFSVVNTDTGEIVYSGDVIPGGTGGSSGDTVGWADFSAVNTPGTYQIVAENSEASHPFVIGEDVYTELLKSTTRMLYLQRCGTKIPNELAGRFGHNPCHTTSATIYGTDEQIDVSGGWHDAGDYGRYTVPGAKAAADLLLAYEMNPSVFTDDFGIAESGNGIPDVLDEVRYELEWLMKMQRSDGGVYHKVTGLNFDGTIMPQSASAKLYVLPVSATATGDFAAVMYLAARIFADVDAQFADDCLRAASLSLVYSEEHRGDVGFHNPSDVLTGEYPDDNAQDEYFWAICEGYRTTGDKSLAEKIAEFDTSLLSADGMGWIDMSGYAYYADLCAGNDRFLEAFLQYVGSFSDVIPTESYHSSIAEDYPWGSNMTIANNGILLLMAQKFTKNDNFRALAQTQLDYLLGVNTNDICFVSGFGTVCLTNPHHRPSQAKGGAIPGMLSGGPNSNLEDPYAANVLRGAAKAACYVDSNQSYSTNEVAIYWNSPLVWLIAGLMQ